MLKKIMIIVFVFFFVPQAISFAGQDPEVRGPDFSLMTVKHPDKDLTFTQKMKFNETGVYELWQIETKEGVELPFIEHYDTYKTIMVFKGSIKMKIGVDDYTINPKQMVHMVPFTPYSMTMDKGTKAMVVYSGRSMNGNPKSTNHIKDLLKVHNDLTADIHKPLPINPKAKPGGELRKWDKWIEHYNFGWLELGIKVASYETFEKYECWGMWLNPKPDKPATLPLHFHKIRFEVWMVVSGETFLGTESGEWISAPANSIIIMPPLTPHRPKTEKETFLLTLNSPGDYQAKEHDLAALVNYHPIVMMSYKYKDIKEYFDEKHDSFKFE